MRYSNLVNRVGGDGSDAWAIHYAAIERQRLGDEIIVLSIGQEMLEATPPPIVESANRSLSSTRHHYSEIGGEPELLNALAKKYTTEFGFEITASNLAIFSGAQNALFAASLCILQAGDEAIIIEPYYATYPATFSAGGAKVITLPTKAENDFQPAIDDIWQKLSNNTRVIVLNSPHNPGGIIYSDEFIYEIIQICQRREIWLICDEVYSSLAPEGGFRSPASVAGAFETCITVSSVSKSHRMTGWRVGWVVAPQPLIKHLINLSVCMAYGLPMFIQDATVTALELGDNITGQVRNQIDRNRNMTVKHLNAIDGITVRGSVVGMFVTIDIRSLEVSDIEFAWQLLDRYEVAVMPCSAFGSSGKGIIRINIGETQSTLTTACERIAQLVNSY